MTTTNQKPAAKLRDGNITATIWKNQSEKGAFYSVEVERSYRDTEETYKSSKSFSGTDLLKVSRLAAKAYDHIEELGAEA